MTTTLVLYIYICSCSPLIPLEMSISKKSSFSKSYVCIFPVQPNSSAVLQSLQLLTIHLHMFHCKEPSLNRQTLLEMLESLHNLYSLRLCQQTWTISQPLYLTVNWLIKTTKQFITYKSTIVQHRELYKLLTSQLKRGSGGRRKRTDPAPKLVPYVLMQSFNHMSHWSWPTILHLWLL